MSDIQNNPNLAETLAKEMKQPIIIPLPDTPPHISRVAYPEGWRVFDYDDEKHLPAPARKKATVRLTEAASFVDYIKRHGSLATSTTWCKVNYTAGDVDFISIINDHGEEDNQPAWRDHTVRFTPEFSEEWKRWNKKNSEPFSQFDFAGFIEENLKDIVSVNGSPSGAEMLGMALSFEANQDMKFKSAIRLQSGGVNMSFVQDDDAQTVAQMKMFDRFTLGMTVFRGAKITKDDKSEVDAYQVDARLRYRQREGKLTFYYELIRPDKTLESATKTLIETLRAETGNPFFFGNPFVS